MLKQPNNTHVLLEIFLKFFLKTVRTATTGNFLEKMREN